MGVPGPGGPCSEIYYDRGPEYGREGGPEVDEDRYLEVWNLVFMQDKLSAVRVKDDFDIEGELPSRNIDTGMGLERMAAILQGVDNIYEVDTMWKVLDRAAELTEQKYGRRPPRCDVALRVVADHVRTAVMLVDDGVMPSNEVARLRAPADPAAHHPQPAAAGAAAWRRGRPGRARGRGEPHEGYLHELTVHRDRRARRAVPRAAPGRAPHPGRDRWRGGRVQHHAAQRAGDLRRRGRGGQAPRHRHPQPASRRSSCTTPTASRSTSPWRWRPSRAWRWTRRGSGG